MKFIETPLQGAFIVEIERIEDERGFFARTWCEKEFAAQGLNTHFKQCSISRNKRKATLRGMHLQRAPYSEVKLVRCTNGSIFDVIIDLRPDSPTLKQWHGERLDADNCKMLYIPEGFAHGFQTLTEEAEVFYQISTFYESSAASGVRWDDPAFGIEWPAADSRIISERDANYPDFEG